MKILFYVEPHGVRDTFFAHQLPFKQFRSIVTEIYHNDNERLGSVDARIFANHFVGGLSFPDFFSEWPLILQPSKAERAAIEDAARMWKFHGMTDWVELMRNPDSEIAKLYYSILKRIKETEFDFDVIVSWGENAAVKLFAEANGIQQVYVELASMRAPFPNALLVDPLGVNGSSSTTKLNMSALTDMMCDLPSAALPVLLNEELSPGQQSAVIPQARYRTMSSDVREFVARPGPVALVPLQLADDANQLIYSRFRDVESFAQAAVEPLLEAGYRVILKGHPSAVQRGGYVMNVQRNCLRKYSGNPSVLALEAGSPASDYLPMLDAVDLVVTNNSSVGFEAMLMGRLSVVLGLACYAPADALPSLSEAISSRLDMDTRAHWLQRSRLVTTYMLACAFPLCRRLGTELVQRAEMWSGFDNNGAHNEDWLREMVGNVSWSTWSQTELTRQMTVGNKTGQAKRKLSGVLG
ncbi:hypothetical protein BLJAPNOD_05536 [Ensifer sp. M14]|uniref:capsular polysaccharide export protein, LipB/KpsS family n=1 Tax=Ensifer sp. M14 TaxID=2203782 RepID=UPI000E1D0245|nr:hypothetical protein [Ensifer sp. M14]RDL47612.1 hypothetical protein BLJAPNOD_05536 [Ensifer sp. M14]